MVYFASSYFWCYIGEMRRELLAEYFIEHSRSPGEPPGVRLPSTSIGLYILAGYARTYNNNPNVSNRGSLVGGALPGWERWRVFVRTFPELRRWLRSPAAFVPPNTWPQAIQGILPRHVTPTAFASAVLPCGKQEVRHSPFYRGASIKGLRALSAYAHGWPIKEAELVSMALASHEIQTLPQFVVWAYNPLLDIVPLPSSEHGILEHSRCRTHLNLDPLSVGKHTLNKALPVWSRDAEYLKDLPRQRFEPRRSSKKPVIADLSVVPRQKSWQV